MAIEGGHLQTVEDMMKHDVPFEGPSSSFTTPLILACKYGHISLISYFIQQGSSVNEKDDLDKTGLIHATEKGHFDAVFLLLQQEDISLDEQDAQGYTAMMYAAENGCSRIFALLESKGAQQDLLNRHKKSAFDLLLDKQERDFRSYLRRG